MYIVVFRAAARDLDAEYARTAERLRQVAMTRFGCLGFHSVTQDDEEISLSYWPSEEAIRDWKADSEHVLAQEAGRQRWYTSYSVDVAEVTRSYTMKTSSLLSNQISLT